MVFMFKIEREGDWRLFDFSLFMYFGFNTMKLKIEEEMMNLFYLFCILIFQSDAPEIRNQLHYLSD